MLTIFGTASQMVELAAQMLTEDTVIVYPMLDGELPLSKVENSLLRMQHSEVIKLAVVPTTPEL